MIVNKQQKTGEYVLKKTLGWFQVFIWFYTCSPVFCCLFTILARKKQATLEGGASNLQQG